MASDPPWSGDSPDPAPGSAPDSQVLAAVATAPLPPSPGEPLPLPVGDELSATTEPAGRREADQCSDPHQDDDHDQDELPGTRQETSGLEFGGE